MLCTKCGQEYEGSQCPRCDGPVILVNNSDYLARRKAYEEKQALKDRSASSDKKDESPKEIGQAIKKAVKKTLERNDSEKERNKDKEKRNDKEKNKDARTSVRIARHKSKKRWKIIGVLAVLLVVVIAAAFGIYRLSKRKNYELFVSYNNKIYDIAGIDSNYICDESDAVFAADNKTFYIPEWPDDIDKSQCIRNVASDNGKYYVSVVYDESRTENKYSMYIWNKGECILVSEDDLDKDILYVSDDGVVIYTNTNVINDEGGMDGTSLVVVSVKEVKKKLVAQTYTVEANLNRAYVYSDKKDIIYLNATGNLYSYSYDKTGKPVLIADSVSQLWMPSESKNVYTGMADSLINVKDAETFIYGVSDGVYYYNNADSSLIKIDSRTDTDADYVYDTDNSVIYRINSSSVRSAIVADKKVSEYNEIDSMTKEKNYLYISQDKQLIYVNADNVLRVVADNKISDIDNNVSAGTLSKVYNKSKAITYVSDSSQYYMDNIKSKKVAVLTSVTMTSTEGTHFYKNRIYSYDSDNILYSNTLKGNSSSEIGYVERLWLGTQLK